MILRRHTIWLYLGPTTSYRPYSHHQTVSPSKALPYHVPKATQLSLLDENHELFHVPLRILEDQAISCFECGDVPFFSLSSSPEWLPLTPFSAGRLLLFLCGDCEEL